MRHPAPTAPGTRRSTRRRLLAGVMALGALGVLSPPRGAAVSIPVSCAGMQVGTITMTADVLGAVTGTFTANAPMFPTLSDAATKCGEDHFNWYQVVVADNRPPVDPGGTRLTSPYVDPPPGGYGNDPTLPGDQTLWADNLPWFYNEGPNPPPGTPGYNPTFDLANQTTADTLSFEDAPGGPLGTNVLFKTWLVSLNADSSFHSFHGGVTWNFILDLDAKRHIVQLNALTTAPTRAEYQDRIVGFATAVPEPTTLALLACGLAALGAAAWSRPRRR